MNAFESLKLSKALLNAIDELGFDRPTPIQEQSIPVIASGKDMVGIAQTGTGKTFAYLMPLLKELKFSKDPDPRILILVPTRELVLQVVEEVESLARYMSVRTLGVYGGVNMNTQALAVADGCDVLVATPGRLYDLTLNGFLKLKSAKKFVIDEVDVMLDLGFRHQLVNIMELLPQKRQNIMFSATMTEEVDELIDSYFIEPVKVSVALSGTPLHNIEQQCYPVPNFNTKVNLLLELLSDRDAFSKVLVFVSTKRFADRLFDEIGPRYGTGIGVIHSNKSQNFRMRTVQEFDEGKLSVLIATDVMSRGLDFNKVSHVINFDTPEYPENYMHRIGRTGRAEAKGKTILFYTPKEKAWLQAIEELMDYEVPQEAMPEYVDVSHELIPEERPKLAEVQIKRKIDRDAPDKAFHEKKEKNKKTNQGGSYLRKKKKYKKPKTRGDKKKNLKRKK